MSMQTLETLTTHTRVARVDLLPPEIEEGRRFNRLRAGLALGLVGVLGIAGAAYAITLGHVDRAGEALAAEQARTSTLQAEQAKYAEVPKILSEIEAVERLHADATAYDIAWYGYLDSIAGSAPEKVALKSLTFTVTPPSLTNPPDAAAANPLAVPGVGTVDITGETTSQETVAAWMDSLGAIPGFSQPALSSSAFAKETGLVTFVTSATVTDDALLRKQ
ncbi:Tfp pilus assembly protein PilN [Kineococcus xinjiangensis]|uniref:Tfp pilus assembly protein PilN n=1 Tax=Kineococcus xinjiangensis TaxID=512762 RepID=A0A2S6IP17_9ACTN|nr:PilN domain-containing protein [Kineococcus xinjiangensis]PPK96002.1 Tfp pilus assembly protein PilN [Kineococcus xinjiangensis]